MVVLSLIPRTSGHDNELVEVEPLNLSRMGPEYGENQLLAWVNNLHSLPLGVDEDGSMSGNADKFFEDTPVAGGVSMTNVTIRQSPRETEPTYWRVRMSEVVQKILGDRLLRTSFFGQIGPRAQHLLDGLQKFLDTPEPDPINDDVKQLFLKALLRLCAESGMYPRSLTLLGVHRQGQPLTAGTFGEIWKGDFGNKVVCLKIVKLYQTSDVNVALKKFIKEAIVWSHLIHPNVLPFYGIYHLGDGSERVCLVSPWMEHGNITAYLRVHPNAPRVLLIHEILDGLEYLHHKGIIHGDLKGDNILISTSGSAYIADFGLSSVLDSDFGPWTSWRALTNTGGTIRWMAPEVVEGGIDGNASLPTKMADIYSLGSVIYEILTGRIPYHDKKDVTVTLRVIQGLLPERNPSISNGMWDLIQWCWRYSPQDRPEIWQIRAAMNFIFGLRGQGLSNIRATEEVNSYLLFRSTFRNAMYGKDNELSHKDMEPFLEILQEGL